MTEIEESRERLRAEMHILNDEEDAIRASAALAALTPEVEARALTALRESTAKVDYDYGRGTPVTFESGGLRITVRAERIKSARV